MTAKTPRLIGLTGRMGSGKSQVEALLRDRRVPVLDMDEVTRDAYADPTNPAALALVGIFGTDIAAVDGSIDKTKARALFAAGQGDVIESKLRDECLRRIAVFRRLHAAESRVVFSMAPLRAADWSIFDEVWWVRGADLPARLAARDSQRPAGEVDRLLARQLTDDELADKFGPGIDNTGPLDSLGLAVDEFVAGRD